MSAIKLDLTTSFQDVSGFGPQRQVCVSGASADFIADIYIGSDTNNNVVKIGRIIGPQASLALQNSSPTLKYVLVRGSLSTGAIWLQGTAGTSVGAVLSTSLASTAAIGPNRQLFLTASSASLAIDVYGSESTTGQRVRIASLIGNPNGTSVPIPNDSSLAMEYVVVKGTLGTASVLLAGSSVTSNGTNGGVGVGQMVAAGIVNADGTTLNGYGFTSTRSALGTYKITMTSKPIVAATPIFCKLYHTSFTTARWIEYSSSLINGSGFLEFTLVGITDTADTLTSIDVAFEFFVVVTSLT